MRTLVRILLAAVLSAGAMGARAADAPAGATVTNVASATYVDSGGNTLTQTATAVFNVQQLVNVTVTWQNSSDVSVSAGSVQQTLLFRVTNTGNGSDSFRLTDALVTPGGVVVVRAHDRGPAPATGQREDRPVGDRRQLRARLRLQQHPDL